MAYLHNQRRLIKDSKSLYPMAGFRVNRSRFIIILDDKKIGLKDSTWKFL